MKVLVREVALKQEDCEHLWLSPITSVHGRFTAINLQKRGGKGTEADNRFPSIVFRTTPRDGQQGMRRGRKSEPAEHCQAE